MLKLRTDAEQRDALLRTMGAYTYAFNVSAEWGFQNKTCNRIGNHYGTYHEIRAEIPQLNSGLVQAARDCACEELKRAKLKKLPSRKRNSAIRYNKNAARIGLAHGFASLSTIEGRMRFNFNQSNYLDKFKDWRVINSVLIFDRRVKDFFLGVTVQKQTPKVNNNGRVLGIDRGLRNLVVTSDNRFFNSKRLNGVRGRYAHNRQRLQAKGTRSAKRRLKKMSGREKRFIACENHKLSKILVESDFDNIAIENLKGITRQRKISPDMRSRLNQWPLGQFKEFLTYKAEERGKIVIEVDPFFTSRKCSRCGHNSIDNRKGVEFKCVACGYRLNADLNAARNIADAGISCISRLPVNQPNASCDEGRTLKWDSGVAEHRCKYLTVGNCRP
jgi:putative transposase